MPLIGWSKLRAANSIHAIGCPSTIPILDIERVMHQRIQDANREIILGY